MSICLLNQASDQSIERTPSSVLRTLGRMESLFAAIGVLHESSS